MGDIVLFSGTAHPELAAEICSVLGVELAPTHVQRFSNDCLQVQLRANCRQRDVFIVQPLVPPVQENLVELLLMLDAARGASAAQITAVIPHYAYARSDKKDAPRISIAGRLVADLIATAGADRVMTMALHAPQVHGFFGVPVAAGSKRRLTDDTVAIDYIVGDVTGKDVVILDDEIATGASVVQLLDALVPRDVQRVSIACTHGLFTGGAIKRLSARPEIDEIVTTNTVPQAGHYGLPNLEVRSVAPLFAEAIDRIHLGESVSSLFSDVPTHG
jgi:ribose-phosphate pyrophosphokinase